MMSRKQSNQRIALTSKVTAQQNTRRTHKEYTEELQIKRNLSARKLGITTKIGPMVHAATPRNGAHKYSDLTEKNTNSNVWGKKVSFQKVKGEQDLFLKSDRTVTPPTSEPTKRIHRSKSRNRLELDALRDPIERKFISLRQISPNEGEVLPIPFEPVAESVNESLTESLIARDFVGIKDSLEVEKGHHKQSISVKKPLPAVIDNLRLNFRKSGAETAKRRRTSPSQTNLVDVNLSSYDCVQDQPYSPLLSRNNDQMNFESILSDSINSPGPRRFNLQLKPTEISIVEDIEADPTLRFQESSKLPKSSGRYEERRDDFIRDISEKFESLDRLINQIEVAKGIDLGLSKSVLRSEFVKIYSQL